MPITGFLMKEVSMTKEVKLIVTTHSTDLVDSFTQTPEDVLVTEKYGTTTEIKRLIKKLLPLDEETTLGGLWIMGAIGGNI
jgi:hypothetical protein